jgi:hypothetical protein
LAPDALSPLAVIPEMMMTAGSYKRKRSREEMLEDFIAAYELPKITQRL